MLRVVKIACAVAMPIVLHGCSETEEDTVEQKHLKEEDAKQKLEAKKKEEEKAAAEIANADKDIENAKTEAQKKEKELEALKAQAAKRGNQGDLAPDSDLSKQIADKQKELEQQKQNEKKAAEIKAQQQKKKDDLEKEKKELAKKVEEEAQLKKDFDAAVERVKKDSPGGKILEKKATHDDQKEMYGLFKVANAEDFNEAWKGKSGKVLRPGNPVQWKKGKYDAWKKVIEDGTTQQEAMKKYVEFINELGQKYGF